MSERQDAAIDGGRLDCDALARRYGLDGAAAAGLTLLLAHLDRATDAPTTVRSREAILRDHLADSLVALELPAVRRARRIADLGSGAGFPGLVLALALPAARVSLVESNGRKCEFIAAAAAACGAANVVAVHARAEEWRDGLGSCDLVVARALAPLPVVAEYAAPLLRLEGWLVVWRGRRDPADEAAGAAAARELGLEVAAPVPVWPYPGALHRHLHPMVKRAQTPARFPRRPGAARKRPLAGRRPAGPSDRARR